MRNQLTFVRVFVFVMIGIATFLIGCAKIYAQETTGTLPCKTINQSLEEAAATGDLDKIRTLISWGGNYDTAALAAAQAGQSKALKLINALEDERYSSVRTSFPELVEAGPLENVFWTLTYGKEDATFFEKRARVKIEKTPKTLTAEELIDLGLKPDRKLHRANFHFDKEAYALGITCSQTILEAAVLEQFDTKLIELLAAHSSAATKKAAIEMITKAEKWNRNYPAEWKEAIFKILK